MLDRVVSKSRIFDPFWFWLRSGLISITRSVISGGLNLREWSFSDFEVTFLIVRIGSRTVSRPEIHNCTIGVLTKLPEVTSREGSRCLKGTWTQTERRRMTVVRTLTKWALKKEGTTNRYFMRHFYPPTTLIHSILQKKGSGD